MAKENVFIVLTHKNSLKKDPKTGKCLANQWEVQETVEFVNQLRNRHTTFGSVIGDYLNEKIVTGTRFGFDEYSKLDSYVRKKYPKQMKQLDEAYRPPTPVEENTEPVFVDEFGNVRTKTVFDV